MNTTSPSTESTVERRFSMEHFTGSVTEFIESTAPDYLKYGGPAGSTMDNRWFWNDHVMKLEVGQSVDTDFNTITRMSDND
jgi:hypothetical protein